MQLKIRTDIVNYMFYWSICFTQSLHLYWFVCFYKFTVWEFEWCRTHDVACD